MKKNNKKAWNAGTKIHLTVRYDELGIDMPGKCKTTGILLDPVLPEDNVVLATVDKLGQMNNTTLWLPREKVRFI